MRLDIDKERSDSSGPNFRPACTVSAKISRILATSWAIFIISITLSSSQFELLDLFIHLQK